jgi:hypothetical protein
VAIENFTYFDANGAPIEIYRALWSKPLSQLPANIAFVALCICKQKNNDNFQKIIYSRCNKNPFLWPVYVAFRIYCRGLRLGARPQTLRQFVGINNQVAHTSSSSADTG